MQIKGLNVSDREKTTILAGLLVVLVVAFYFYVYQPNNAEMELIRADLDVAQTRLNQVQQIADDPGGFEAQMNANRTEIEAIEQKLPSGGNSPELVRIIEDKAKDNNLKVVSLKPGEVVDKGEYQSFNWELELRGSYFDIIKYCQAIEKLPRLVNLAGWNLQKEEGGAIKAMLKLEAYGGKGNNPIPPAPIKVPDQNRNPFI